MKTNTHKKLYMTESVYSKRIRQCKYCGSNDLVFSASCEQPPFCRECLRIQHDLEGK